MRISMKCKIGIMSNRSNTVLFILLLLSLSSRLYGHKVAEHADITEKAIANYKTWVAEDEDNRVGSDAITRFSGSIISGSKDEDSVGIAPWYEHYFDPDTYGGLIDPITGLPHASAYDRATDEDHWPAVFDYYEDGDYEMAYWTLGRVIHLVEDMGVPAHVLLDPHWPDLDWYEATYIPDHHLEHTDTSNLDTIVDLGFLMHQLAEISDDFDSDDRDGEDEESGVDRSDGFSDTEGAIIANACYPMAIEAAGSVIRSFYDCIKPTVEFQHPSEGEIHSGIIGIPFEAQAKTYNKSFSQPWYIQKIKFYYSEMDTPTLADWTLSGSAEEYDGDHVFKHNWNNDIDDDKVWVRAIAVDDGDCESVVSDKYWIKIDSTRPTVEW